MTTISATMTIPATQPAALLKMMAQAQERNTQPKPMVYGRYPNGAAKPVVYTVEAVIQIMAMAQQRNLQPR